MFKVTATYKVLTNSYSMSHKWIFSLEGAKGVKNKIILHFICKLKIDLVTLTNLKLNKYKIKVD